MKLATKTRHGLRILQQIALTSINNSPVKGNVLSKKQQISKPYLEQIMIPLKESGFVKTIRGRNGGYILKKDPEDINLLQIIELFEGKLQLVRCIDDQYKCSRYDNCPATEVWKGLSDILRKKAAQINLAGIMNNILSS